MSREQLQGRIIHMMAETFELDPGDIQPGSRLYEDLELDSIDALDLVVKLQELTKRRVREDELRALRTVSDVVDMVEVATGQAEQAG